MPAPPQQRSPITQQRYLESEFLTSVSLGDVYGHRIERVNADARQLGTTKQDVWSAPAGTILNYPTAAAPLSIVSTSASDDGSPASTGARTVILFGLNASYATLPPEVLTMNGTTPITTANSYLRVDNFLVLTTGSLGASAGTITVSHPTSGTQAVIRAGESQSLASHYTVPAGEEAIPIGYFIDAGTNSVGGKKDDKVAAEFMVRIPHSAGFFPFQRGRYMELSGRGPFKEEFTIPPIVFPAKTDAKWMARKLSPGGGSDGWMSLNMEFLVRKIT